MAKFVKVDSLRETLKALPPGESMIIKPREYRESVVKMCAHRLKSNGYLFVCSEAGLPSGIKVTRIK